MSLMRDRAGRPPVAARAGQTAGRHERRPHLVDSAGPAARAAQATATRAARSRHAGSAGWAKRARRLGGQALAWWTEGTDRLAARAAERWAEQATGAKRTGPGGTRTVPSGGGRGLAVDGDRAAGLDTGGRTLRTLASVDGDSPQPAAGPVPRHLAAGGTDRWEDLVTGWCSVLVVLGLYLDGWNHNGLEGDATRPFLTPWHAVLYAAIAGTAAWILTQGQRRGAWSLRAVPAGYRLGLAGVGLAVVAVAGDAAWHVLGGAEQGLARLVAPFHLVLFAGACLLATATLRAAWSGPSSARMPGLAAFWPVALSATLVVATAAFFFQQVSPLVTWRQPAAGTGQLYELLGLLAHNLLFVAPVLLLLLRWQTPLGTFTVMAGSVALLLATQADPGLLGLAGAAVLGGAAADVAVTLLRPSPHRRWAARTVAVVAPAVYWTAHFALLGAGYRVPLAPQAAAGSVLWASISGLSLALLMWPPAVPLTAWNRGRSSGRSAARPATTPTGMPARMVGR